MTDPTQSKAQNNSPSGAVHPPVPETGFSAEWNGAQALANAMIEGYEPSPEFLEDSRLLRAGLITSDELMQRIRNRALSKKTRQITPSESKR